MASPIEDIIEEIEVYLDECKPSAFSSTKIVVNRDDLLTLVSELKSKIPEEVSRYQKIINNQDSIIAAAKRQAKEIIDAAKIHTNELVSEHQIMRQAYAQANEVVMIATKEAQNSLDSATRDANEIRRSAIRYTDDLLQSIQEVLAKSIDTTRSRQDSYINTMQGYLNIITENRIQLNPNPIAEEILKDENPEVLLNDTGALPVVSDSQVDSGLAPSKEPAQTESPENNPDPAAATAVANKEISKTVVPNSDLGAQVTGVIDIPDTFFKKD